MTCPTCSGTGVVVVQQLGVQGYARERLCGDCRSHAGPIGRPATEADWQAFVRGPVRIAAPALAVQRVEGGWCVTAGGVAITSPEAKRIAERKLRFYRLSPPRLAERIAEVAIAAGSEAAGGAANDTRRTA